MVKEIQELLSDDMRVVLLVGNEERRTAVHRWLERRGTLFLSR